MVERPLRPTNTWLTRAVVRVIEHDFGGYDDISSEVPDGRIYDDAGELFVGIYKPSVAAFISDNAGDSAYDEPQIWTNARAVIARFKVHVTPGAKQEIKLDKDGVPKIVLVLHPWTAAGRRIAREHLMVNRNLAPYIRIKDWRTVRFMEDLRKDDSGSDRGVIGVWRAVRAKLILSCYNEDFSEDEESHVHDRANKPPGGVPRPVFSRS